MSAPDPTAPPLAAEHARALAITAAETARLPDDIAAIRRSAALPRPRAQYAALAILYAEEARLRAYVAEVDSWPPPARPHFAAFRRSLTASLDSVIEHQQNRFAELAGWRETRRQELGDDALAPYLQRSEEMYAEVSAWKEMAHQNRYAAASPTASVLRIVCLKTLDRGEVLLRTVLAELGAWPPEAADIAADLAKAIRPRFPEIVDMRRRILAARFGPPTNVDATSHPLPPADPV